MVIDSFGYQLRVVDLLRVAVPMGSISADAGTYNWNYINSPELGQKYGFTVQLLYEQGSNRINQYKTLAAQGQPVISPVKDDYFYAGHFIVVVAYNPANDTFTVNDPDGRAMSAPNGTVTQQWSASFLLSIQNTGPSILITNTKNKVS
jgi:hypothetical protein